MGKAIDNYSHWTRFFLLAVLFSVLTRLPMQAKFTDLLAD
jgi:hypothetical protein